MTYRTSLPLHPTEDDKPKKKKKRALKATLSKAVAEGAAEALQDMIGGMAIGVGKSLPNKKTGIKGPKAPTPLTKRYNKPK